MKLENINEKWRIINCKVPILAILSVFILFPDFLFIGIPSVNENSSPWESLDPSWNQGVLFAKVKNVVWGEDLVFTYGPLSFLATRFITDDLKWMLIGFDIFLSLNLFGFLYVKFKTSNHFLITVILVVLFTLIIPTYLGSGVPVLLFLLLIFWIVQSFKEPNHVNFILQSLILSLLFFIKFNTGLVSFAFVVLGTIYRFYAKANFKWWSLIYIGFTFLLITILSGYLNVSIPSYISGGINIINGYNDIMYIFDKSNLPTIIFAVISILTVFLLLLFSLIKDKKSGPEIIFYLTIFSMASYILFKQGFTRGDAQHIEEFYMYFIILAMLFAINNEKPHTWTNKIQITSTIFILVIFCFKISLYPIDFGQTLKRFDKSKYYLQISQTKSSFSDLFSNEKSFNLPQRIIDKIGQQSVDVIPWNMMMAFENKLNFTQRPIFQSYSAYNKFLGDLNASFYQSDEAPKFVLYELQTIDYRYPLFDEPKTQLIILRNYSCVDTFNLNNRLVLLLEKKKNASKIKLVKSKSYQLHINDSIIPQENRFYEILIEKKIKGKIKSLVFHSPSIQLSIQTVSGRKNVYRTSKNLLESGIYVTPLFSNTEDTYRYLNKSIENDSNKIQSFKIIINDFGSFENNYTVNEYLVMQ